MRLRTSFWPILACCPQIAMPVGAYGLNSVPLYSCPPCSEYDTGSSQPAWSPDGNYIALAGANWYPPYYFLWAYVFVTPAKAGVEPMDSFYYGEHSSVMDPAWNPSGDRLVFSTIPGLYVLSRTGGTQSLALGADYRCCRSRMSVEICSSPEIPVPVPTLV